MTSTSLPKACGDKYHESNEFSINRDFQRRDELISLSARVTDPGIGVLWFEAAPLHTIAQLFAEKFIDPFDRQNLSPTSLSFLDFMCQHPYALAGGFTVGPDRDDYGITLDSIRIPAQHVTADVQADFDSFCQDADEVSTDSDLYCWWD